jgi:hypothetical protein
LRCFADAAVSLQIRLRIMLPRFLRLFCIKETEYENGPVSRRKQSRA